MREKDAAGKRMNCRSIARLCHTFRALDAKNRVTIAIGHRFQGDPRVAPTISRSFQANARVTIRYREVSRRTQGLPYDIAKFNRGRSRSSTENRSPASGE